MRGVEADVAVLSTGDEGYYYSSILPCHSDVMRVPSSFTVVLVLVHGSRCTATAYLGHIGPCPTSHMAIPAAEALAAAPPSPPHHGSMVTCGSPGVGERVSE
jgi:hypothetical protein